MSSEQDPAGARQVYRGAGAVVLWWAWAVFAVAALAVIAVRYHDRPGAVTATVILAITGIMYACAFHPRVVAAPDGITVQNPLRTHVIPWPAVASVDLAQTLQVRCAVAPGGRGPRVVHSWAVQASSRAQARQELRARRAAGRERATSGYGRPPAAAQAASQGPAAEFTVRQLGERLGRERQRAAGAAAATVAPQPGPVRVSWAWAPTAAMAVPVLALVAVLAS